MEETTYALCSAAVGDIASLQTVVDEFFGERSRKHLKTDSDVSNRMVHFVVLEHGPSFAPTMYSDGDISTLQQLCRVKLNDMEFQNSLKRGSDELGGSAPADHEMTELPVTIRVTKIPDSLNKVSLKPAVDSFFGLQNAKVHSLARYGPNDQYATVTFPGASIDLIRSRIKGKQPRSSLTDSSYNINYDLDFLNITPLFDAGKNAVVDIIAVMGLGTHPFGTFRSAEDGSMWLRDFLPGDFSRSRVLLYGYNSAVSNSKSSQMFRDIAKTCLSAIHTFRFMTETTRRPILFLGQCFGGLVIQDILHRSLRSSCARKPESDGEIFDAWFGFIGFSVPTSGLNKMGFEERVKGKPNESLVTDLLVNEYGRRSETLTHIAENFEACRKVKTTEVIYFRENIVSSPKGYNTSFGAISPTSSSSGIRVPETHDTGIKTLTLEKDHSGMVKFHKNDDSYRIVKENMDRMIKTHVSSNGSSGYRHTGGKMKTEAGSSWKLEAARHSSK